MSIGVSLQRGQMLSGRQPPALSKAFVVVKRVTVQCRSNTKVAQHQPSKTEQGRLNMQIKTKMLILPSEREKGRRAYSR